MRPPSAPVFLALLATLACGPDREAPAPQESPPSPAADLEAARLEIATLREALAAEQAEREALEAELDRLRAELDDVGWSDAAREGETKGADAKGEGRQWFDADGLLEHGVEPAEVDRVREAFDASEMALLELEDQARREGWFDQPRYRESLRDTREALRAELGDDRFDLLLYASGRRNRVVVKDVLNGSPAQRAGIQRGDEILSYGAGRVFRAHEVKVRTTAGRPGDHVPIDVLRAGRRERLWVSYGPLGVQLGEENRPPP
jgi:hypothetical protein